MGLGCLDFVLEWWRINKLACQIPTDYGFRFMKGWKVQSGHKGTFVCGLEIVIYLQVWAGLVAGCIMFLGRFIMEVDLNPCGLDFQGIMDMMVFMIDVIACFKVVSFVDGRGELIIDGLLRRLWFITAAMRTACRHTVISIVYLNGSGLRPLKWPTGLIICI